MPGIPGSPSLPLDSRLLLYALLLPSEPEQLARDRIRASIQSESTGISGKTSGHESLMDPPQGGADSAREDRALLNGVRMVFEALQTFQSAGVTNGMSLPEALRRFGRDSPADGSTKPPQKASGIGSRGLQVPSADQKSLEILHFSSSILLLAEYDCGWGYFCFIDSAQVAVRPRWPLPSKLFLFIDLVVGFPCQAGDCFDD